MTQQQLNIQWRDIPGYEGMYQASSTGIIRSIDREVFMKNGARANYKGRTIRTVTSHDGYLKACLSKDCVCKTIKVHRLVALAFLRNPKNKETVNHKDGNKLNNHVDNLEWATRGDQVEHAYRNRLIKAALTNDQVAMIKRLFVEINDYHLCARVFGLSWHMAKYYVNKRNPIGVLR